MDKLCSLIRNNYFLSTLIFGSVENPGNGDFVIRNCIYSCNVVLGIVDDNIPHIFVEGLI